ncbi:MAG: STAS domain-containing protein [Spirochaetes bacterium]|nr:STAS domain-containing protein [Spirochaetota bacterium]
MEIAKKYDDNVVIFSIEGDVSIFYKDSIDKALSEEIEKGNFLFVFNFAHVNYIDSVGISLLIQAGNASYEHGKQAIIVSANPKVRYVIELARLERILKFHDTIGDAVDFLKE